MTNVRKLWSLFTYWLQHTQRFIQSVLPTVSHYLVYSRHNRPTLREIYQSHLHTICAYSRVKGFTYRNVKRHSSLSPRGILTRLPSNKHFISAWVFLTMGLVCFLSFCCHNVSYASPTKEIHQSYLQRRLTYVIINHIHVHYSYFWGFFSVQSYLPLPLWLAFLGKKY